MTHTVTKTSFVITDKDLLKYKDPEKRKKYKRDFMRDYMKKWRHSHPEEQHKRERRYYANLKRRAMDRLGGAKCVNCGSEVLSVLEINHKNGGGRKQLATIRAFHNLGIFYRAIINEKVDIKELDVRCRVCNALYYVQETRGIKGYAITYTRPEEVSSNG